MALALRLGDGRTTEAEYERFAELNPLVRVELSPDGEVIVSPPPGGWAAHAESDLLVQVDAWCRRTEYGLAFGAAAQFRLPDGSVRIPDVSVVRRERFEALTQPQREGYLPLCPELVIEVVSPSDRRENVAEKLTHFRAQGALVTVLFDPDGPVVVHDARGERSADRPDAVSVAVPDVREALALELRELYRPR